MIRRRRDAPQLHLDKKALCAALRIRQGDERTEKFLDLVEHDLLYLTNPAFRARFDRHLLREKIIKRLPLQKARARSRKRGRPTDEIARSLVALFRSRIESILELELGLSKRGGPLYEALTIYLGAAGKGKPDRYITWSKPWLSSAEKAALGKPVAKYVRILDEINLALTLRRR